MLMFCKFKSLLIVLFLSYWLAPIQSVSQDIEDITIKIFFDTVPEYYSANLAPLKYNKRFAMSMQVDDGRVDIYERGFPVFEGGTVGSTQYNGFNYTDGCGNFKSFKMSSAIYVFNVYDGSDAHTDPASDIITWDELDILVQNGWGVLNHGVNTDDFNIDDFMNYSVARNMSYTRRKMYSSLPGGVITDVFVNPNGKLYWNFAAFENGCIGAFNEENVGPLGEYGGNVNDADYNFAEEPYNFRRRNGANTDVVELADSLYNQSKDGANFWSPIYTHDFGSSDYRFNDFVSDFEYIYETYGAAGSDEILMTTDKEILDYLILRDGTTTNKELFDSVLTITLTGSHPTDLFYYDLSLFIESDTRIHSVEVTGASSHSYSIQEDTTGLINFSWDGKIVPDQASLATEKVQEAVDSQTAYDALIAMDYVYTLDYGNFKAGLVDQLCAIPDVEYDEGFCQSGYPDFVEITGDSVLISGFEGTLTATSGLTSYFWSTGESLVSSITISPEADTEYWVRSITQYGDTVSDSIMVIVEDSYIIDNSPLFVLHTPGNPVNLWVELVPDVTPLWSDGSTSLSIFVDPEETTIYTCYVLVDGEEVQSLDFEVFVGNILDFTYDTVCLGDTTTFINTTETSDTIVNVVWDLNGDAVFDDGTGDAVNYKYSTAGNHLVGMRVYFKNYPMDVVYNPVPVGYKPFADFSYTNTCLGYNTEFFDESTIPEGNIDKWFWTFGDGKQDQFQNPTCLYDETGTYEVNLVVWSEFGCADTTTQNVEIVEIEDIEIVTSAGTGVYDNDTIYFSKGSTETLTVVNFENYDSIIWSNDDRAQKLIIADSGEYRVDAFTSTCDNYLRFYASWGNSPTPSGDNIMNIFTPNGDGYNDYWLVNDPDMTYPIKVAIYTRSGKPVYESNSYDNTWSGTYNGNALPQGAYYYLIEDAQGKEFKGSITIIR